MITLLHGDNTTILPTMAPRSVQCIATSPPYYGLRDYGLAPSSWPEVEYTPLAGVPPIVVPAMSCCLGLEPTPLAYVAHLVYTWRLLREVLRDDGVCWLNLGDSYNGGGGYSPDAPSNIARNNAKNVASKIFESSKRKGLSDLKPKDMLGIPWRAALALQADGWYLRSDVIWSKPNPMPESVTDRPTKSHEYLFLLAKSERYYYDAEAIAERVSPNTHGGAWNEGGGKQASLGQQKGGRLGNSPEHGTRNRRSVWSIATRPYAGAHFATWPESLAELCIKAGSAAQACEVCGAPWVRIVERTKAPYTPDNSVYLTENRQTSKGKTRHQSGGMPVDTVTTTGFAPSCACENTGSAAGSLILDPYAGSGTTLRAAERLQRDSIGIDLNGDYMRLQEQRTDGVQLEILL